MTEIGDGAFEGCTGLTAICVSDANPAYHSSGNCLIHTESNTLIIGCNNSVIPDSVTKIGENAFYGCTGLTSVNIGNSFTWIGDGPSRAARVRH